VFLAEDTAIDPDIVTPGVVGFVATILVAVVTILLVWDMVRRIRRQRYQAEIEAKLDAEQAAASKK
jgi:cytochrome oxidase assembly protein ShyY1